MKTGNAHMMQAMGTKVPAWRIWVPGTPEARLKAGQRPERRHHAPITLGELLTSVLKDGLPSTIKTIKEVIPK